MSVLALRDKFNPLLIKGNIGEGKCRWITSVLRTCALGTYKDLPQLCFAYGKPNFSDSENARTLTSVWKYHEPSKVKIDSNSVNFVSINSKVAVSKNSSARLVNEMAKSVKLKQASHPTQVVRNSTNPESSKCSGDRSFGLPTHVDVSIKDLVQNKFGNDGERETTEKYTDYFEKRMEAGKTHTIVKETRASIARADSLKSLQSRTIKEPFKMSKFKKVESKVKSVIYS